MPAAGDHYILTMKTVASSFPGFPAFNVFAYEQITSTGGAADIAEAFVDTIPVLIAAVLSNLCAIVELNTYCIEDDAEFDLTTFAESGDISGDVLPPFTGWTFQYNRATRAAHNGRKNFGLVPESAWASNAPASGVLPNLTAIGTALGDDLVGASGNYRPRIWRRAGTYKEDGVPTVFPDTFYPVSAVVFKTVGSQNSRKR